MKYLQINITISQISWCFTVHTHSYI